MPSGTTVVSPMALQRDTRENRDTARVRRRYDRIAPIYDLIQGPMELMANVWRARQWAEIEGGQVLEVGVGTGKSLPLHPQTAEVIAIDVSPRMVDRARKRAASLGSKANLCVADVQALPFPDASFDFVVTTFVFCSVPDPVMGLREMRRVLRPGGRLTMIEHVFSRRWWLAPLLMALDPLTTALWGAHLTRDTVGNVARAGYSQVDARDLALDVVKAIHAVR